MWTVGSKLWTTEILYLSSNGPAEIQRDDVEQLDDRMGEDNYDERP